MVSIVLVGFNHQTAPIELREKLSLSGCAMQMALDEISSLKTSPTNGNGGAGHLHESIILSTCNRLEVYAVVDQVEPGWQRIEQFLARLQNISLDTLRPHLYFFSGEQVVVHLMRVASGLGSLILGEPQILGQVGKAFTDAQSAGTTGPILSHLFSHAVHAGKRARAETDISRYTTSVSHAAARLVSDTIGGMEDKHVLIIGAGEMANLAAQALKRFDANQIAFINRTHRRAEILAGEYGGRAMGWHQIQDALVWADAVISATSAPHTVLYASDVDNAMRQRQGRSLLLVDIAVPRDIEETAGTIPHTHRFDIDDLKSTVDANMTQRQAAVPHVEAIVSQEVDNFMEWINSRQVSTVIQNLRQWAQDVATSEVEQAINRLPNSDERTEEIIHRLAHRLVNKLLHEPTVRLRSHAADGNGHGYAHAVQELFGLYKQECQMYEAPAANGHGSTCDLSCLLTTEKSHV